MTAYREALKTAWSAYFSTLFEENKQNSRYLFETVAKFVTIWVVSLLSLTLSHTHSVTRISLTHQHTHTYMFALWHHLLIISISARSNLQLHLFLVLSELIKKIKFQPLVFPSSTTVMTLCTSLLTRLIISGRKL